MRCYKASVPDLKQNMLLPGFHEGNPFFVAALRHHPIIGDGSRVSRIDKDDSFSAVLHTV